MVNKKPVSDLGWLIKQRLAELKMNQKEFCKLYCISESRLSELIMGTRPAKKEREKVLRILNISESDIATEND